MMEEKIREFLLTTPEFSARISGDIGPDQSLIETGIVDSFGLISLISFLEEAFEFRVLAEDLNQENFETLNTICQFVQKKKMIG
ncbi:MAG: acyl carrier protein [Candidatus Uhrbacteria bacterium]|nr:acyl carrier protein [Candidatus Uhrbacteria bacterium]